MKTKFTTLTVLITFLIFGSQSAFGQVIFSDDFESGTSQWILEGQWGLTSSESHSPSNSLTESPSGNYNNNWEFSATMASDVDLSGALGADVKFWAKYDIEVGLEFDNMYLEATKDGTTWTQLARFEGEGVPWTQFSYQLDGFLGNSNVKLRFRFYSDQGYRVDGMYIDDFEISTSDADTVQPLIVHDAPQFYEGSFSSHNVVATITDISSIQSAEVHYMVDSGTVQIISPSSIVGDVYTFTIPPADHGSQIDYQIFATDTLNNTTQNPPTHSFISGEYLFYDNPVVSYLNRVNANRGVAVRITPTAGNERLVYALIRNYTDINNPNDDFEFHVWADDNGTPGADLITPFIVTPEANLQVTSPMTRIDLRAYGEQLSNITSDYFIGFTVPSGTTNITQHSPVTANRSFAWNGSAWNSVNYDYHFRAVMSDQNALPVELTSFTVSNKGSSVQLEWNTATEINNYGFEVERASLAGNWSNIGFVQGYGNSNAPKSYSFTDNPNNGTKFLYRLKQIDTDGQFEYSDIVEVEITPTEFVLEQNFPNPFNPTTKISYTLPERSSVSIKVYDAIGNEIAELANGEKEAGVYEVEFIAENLPTGIYFYHFNSGKFSQTKKMMLLK
ncbi:MAG: T9SS type A sorting domain-containing protein [Ignavibacteriae bacterium]|jgi:hypothetical protein|nr:T9SS C-terminal target domain-containing protein [Ignavibacteriota bacterium]NOG98247.1 T9SS type A sorting domain-containing protein [Ignavibacteriota bacterium]